MSKMERKMESLSLKGSKQNPVFPLKPPRTKPPPGNVVKLICNMLCMSIQQNKPIYKLAVSIEEVEEKDSSEQQGDTKKKPRQPRKISGKMQREIVALAMQEWLRQNKPKNVPKQYSYVLDINGATAYTLFELFPNSKQAKESLNVRVVYNDDAIDGQLKKVVVKKRQFDVKFSKNEVGFLDVKNLFDNCKKSNNTFDVTKFGELIRVINVLMHEKIMALPTHIVTKTSVFPFKNENQFPISPGVLFNRGYSASARPTEGGLMLNVASTGRAFFEAIELTKLLIERFRVRDPNNLRPADIQNLKKEIMTKQIEATHINYGSKQKPHYRKYRVSGIAGSSDKERFKMKDKNTGKEVEMTVAEYFKKEYNYTLRFPQLPCIQSGERKIPLEVCRLVEKQGVVRKMTPDETSLIIKKQAVAPIDHFKMVSMGVNELTQYKQPLNEFGLDFKPEFVKVDGREIKPFSLVGGQRREVVPSNGEYDVRRISFFKPAHINKWALAFIGDSQVNEWLKRVPNADGLFVERYCAEAGMKGVSITKTPIRGFISIDTSEFDLKKNLRSAFANWNQNQIDHVVIILADRSPDWLYRYIQYYEATVPSKTSPRSSRTCCIKFSNFDKKIIHGRDMGKMFISNLWLKHNTKLGGINYVLSQNNKQYNKFLQDGYIFLSVDVCHPAPGDRLIQSVAAVVGMWDLTSEGLSYCTRLRVQHKMRKDHSTIEEVGDIGTMMEQVFGAYLMKKKKLPSKIVIIRDGVSEGQFRMVLNEELKRVNNSLSGLYTRNKSKLPPISCFVVQKRHKIRFRREVPVKNFKGIEDYNIQPGTVVDNTVTHPTDFEFFLAAHKAIQGTSRPARFYVIQDQIGFDQDEAQAMMHALSYLSPRCTKGTSIPTPVNLADLAAERGKNLVICWQDDNIKLKLKEDEILIKLNEMLENIGDANYRYTLYYV